MDRRLHIEMIKMQRWLAKANVAVLVIVEGRDAAGKGGAIRRMVKHLNPRAYRVMALTKPTELEQRQWYFQRYVAHLPAEGEIVFLDRSWYNRAGIEPVMGFCSKGESCAFLDQVPQFELLLVSAGIRLFKFYLSIDQKEQLRRLMKRTQDPLKQWKLTPLDLKAQTSWRAYSEAEQAMFEATSTAFAPWLRVDANDKAAARTAMAQVLLSQLEYDGRDDSLLRYDPQRIEPVTLGGNEE